MQKQWPKIQKSFYSFLTPSEQDAVQQGNENSVENIIKGAMFEETFSLFDVNPNATIPEFSGRKQKLFEVFSSEVFLNKPEIFKGNHNKNRNWIFLIRKFLLKSKNAELIWEYFWEQHKSLYPFQLCGETVAGGILAQLLSLKAEEKGVSLNCFLIRQERKTTGLQNIFEGEIIKNIPVILCDDIFNSGENLFYVLEIFKKESTKMSHIFSFLNYETEQGKKILAQENIQLHSCFTLKDFGIQKKKGGWTKKRLEIEPVWTFKEDPYYGYSVPKSSPCANKTSIFFGTHSSYFYALEKTTGNIQWKFKTNAHDQKKSILSSPALYKNSVIFGSYDGNLYSLDQETGKLLWKFSDADWIGSSPAISHSHALVFIGTEYGLQNKQGGIVAINAETGEKVWEDFFEGFVHSSPAYSEELGVVIIGSNSGQVRLYDAETGHKYWELQLPQETKMSFAFDEKRGLVCFGSFDGKEYIVNVSSGEIIKTIQTGDIIYSSPLIEKNILYWTSSDKKLYGLNLASGEMYAEFLTGGRILSSPVFWNNFIVFGSNDGKVYFINFEKKQCFFIQCTERITNKILFDEQFCFVHLYNNQVLCFAQKDFDIS